MLAPEPLAAMYAAVEAIARGEGVGEIELEWWDEVGGTECRLSVTVRREISYDTDD